MKTGLITFHAAHHYGAMLQAYALAKSVSAITGHCELIDYRRPDTTDGNRVFQRGLHPGTVLKNAHTLLHYPAFRNRYDRFEAFLSGHMPLGEAKYSVYSQLQENAPEYDRLVCGSDQIWNPMIYQEKRFDPSFFCAFSKAGDKIAYAPSIGPASIKGKAATEMRDHLAQFSHLSSREKQGAAVLEKISGKPVSAVLDPTLLLTMEEWGSLATDSGFTLPYVLCYFVSPPGLLKPLVSGVKHRLGIRAVQLAGTRRKVRGVNKMMFDVGPREFLTLFKNASFVLTNSFHGTAFSLIFQRPFLCAAGSGEDALESRTGSLLQTLGLTRRMVSAGGAFDLLDIDYVPITRRLQAERERSLEFLKTALQAGGSYAER